MTQPRFSQWSHRCCKRFQPHPLTVALLGSLVLTTGCVFDSDDNDTPAVTFPAATLYIASNSGDGDTTVRVRDRDLALLNSYTTGANEGVLVTHAGHLIQAGDLMDTGRVVTACNAAKRSSDDPSFQLTGANTTLLKPKGMAYLAEQGLVVVANNTASNLLVIGASAAGNVAPVATVALAANAWDVHYDADGDRLFVAQVDGLVAVFDDFEDTLGIGGASRTFSIIDGDNETSVNLHGIDYDAASDRLIVSDVGQASSPDDGKLYVINNASTANGTVTAAITFKGDNTRLGNPVDLQLHGPHLRIAEKANGGGALLTIHNLFQTSGGNVAPDHVLDTPAPESLAIMPTMMPMPGATDVSDPGTDYEVLVTSNPAVGSATSGQLFTVDKGLESNLALAFSSALASAENVTLDRDGNAYLSYDDGTTANSGLAVIGAVEERMAFSLSRDRLITGSNTRLMSPKGVELADDLGLVIVAEQAGAEILVFSACDSGNATPRVVSTGDVAPWDSDYDASGDTLYVALTNGTVAAYDDFSSRLGSAGPDRILMPEPAATNLHGIRYHAASDTLIVSDVGSGAESNDGALMTLPGASMANGTVMVGKRIANPGDGSDLTGLGNPVDIAFDGQDLYVAEKINGQLQLWRDFLTDDSLQGNVAPSVRLNATAPESVVLMQDR
ncbi:YncE family protein [Marinobacter xestospongiae]|uniref:YncE family protein n=1 Tax=Marinobacter xestospongiae TaxID=994319 RepID=UPI002004462C|nr:hypothetical protein [Marinobacter xestospongiae]MCK7565185.1 hypothetical protein [Marinobacter xestospongiae]